MDDKQLNEIEERCKAATDGPWQTDVEDGVDIIGNSTEIVVDLSPAPVLCCSVKPRNIAFICFSRTDIPALIQAIRDRDTKIIQLEDGIAAAVTDMDIMRAEIRERDMQE